MGEANRGKPLKIFDWDKAARLIKERKPICATAGLEGDWDYTSGEIFANGAPFPREHASTYLASTWATPQIEIDGDTIDCFVMESERPEWNSHTYWPDSAMEILVATDES